MYTPIRWQQRFQNFEKAFFLLRESLKLKKLSQLEKEGIIQRFKYTFELAWKTLSDYLKNQGIEIVENTPKMVIKTAFGANIIKNSDLWIKMLVHRNTMSHQYNFSKYEEIISNLRNSHVKLLNNFYLSFKSKIDE